MEPAALEAGDILRLGCMLSDKTLVCVNCGYVLNYEHKDSKELCYMSDSSINIEKGCRK